MKILNYFLIFIVLFSSCKKDKDEPVIQLASNYGSGMYILTNDGISFFNYLAVDSLQTISKNIYQSVNNINIIQPKSISISGDKIYIVGDKIYIANIETFGNEGIIDIFSEPVDCKIIDPDRLYVVDRGDASVKIIDINTNELSGHIETGNNSSPISIEGSWYRAFVMNGGNDNFVDSSIISIDYFESGVVVN